MASFMQPSMGRDEALPQPDHDPRIQGFLEHVRSKLTTSYSNPTTDETREFVPITFVEKYLAGNDYRKLNEILAALFPGLVPPVDSAHIIRDYLRVICILLRIGKGRYIHYFTSYDGLSDKNLPFDPDDRRRSFPQSADDFYLRFCKEQWTFCVPILHNVTDLRLESDRILPIIHKEKLNTGGSAVLHRIILHEASAERNAHTFVLKTYLSKDAETYYNKEVEAFRHLKAFNNPKTNIIGFYGSYIHGDTFNVILEFADRGSLAQYFKETDPPSTGQDIVDFWSSLFGVIPALINIHDVESDEVDDSGIFQGWHQDIKPQNFLVMSDSSKSIYKCPIKLADLGISHFSKRLASQRDGTTREAHGTRTYGAPECYRSSQLIDRHGLKKRKRVTEQIMPPFNGGDCFHDGDDVLDIVLQTHKHVQSIARTCDHISGKVLDVMVSEMLWPWQPRPNAEQLLKKSQRIVMEANEQLNRVARMSVSDSGPRKPTNIPPPPWAMDAPVRREDRPATWNGSSSSRPLSGTALQNSRLHRAVSHRSPEDTNMDDGDHYPESNSLGMDESEEEDDGQFQPTRSISTRGNFQAPTLPMEATNGFISPLPAADERVDRQQSFKGKGKTETNKLSNTPSFLQMGQMDGPSTPTPKPDSPKPELSLAAALEYKKSKKMKLVTERALPYHWLLRHLNKRDHVFLIDNSASMEPHWHDVIALLGVLAWMIKDADPDGLELYFTVSDGVPIRAKDTTPLVNALTSASRLGATNITFSLSNILDGYQSKLREQKPRRSPWKTPRKGLKDVRRMSLYIFTDGKWEGSDDAVTPIRNLVNHLKHLGFEKGQVGIQFISFGNDPEGLKRLKILDDGLGLDLDIVDTEPYNGNIWKMLLGAINNHFDR
ncbi:hypothetical protein B7463_g7721, partial [Scytalidium lignicola]